MKFKHDPQADAIYVYLSEKPYAYGRDLDDERRIDYASDNTPIGVELLCVSKSVNVDDLPRRDEIVEFLEANGIQTYIMGGYPVTGGVVFNVILTPLATIGTGQYNARIKEEVTV